MRAISRSLSLVSILLLGGVALAASVGAETSTVASQTADCVDDQLEANDARSAASVLQADVFATICPGNRDYFRFENLGGSSLVFDATFLHASGDLDIYLLRADGRALGSGLSVTDNERITFNVPDDAVYYVVMVPYGTIAAEGVPYRLTVTGLAPSCADDGFEDNDLTSAATVFPVGAVVDAVVCVDDDDFFSIDLLAGDVVDVEATFAADNTVVVTLLGPDGTVLGSATSTRDFVTFDHEVGVGGPHRLLVSYIGDSPVGAPYTLFAEVHRRSACSEDSVRIGNRLVLGSSVTGTVCPGTDDLWQLRVEPGIASRITAVFDPGEGNLDLFVVDAAGVVVAQSTLVGGAETVELTSAGGGTYSVIVRPTSGVGPGGAGYVLSTFGPQTPVGFERVS